MKLHSRSVKSILCLCFVGGIAVASVFGDVGAVATPVPGSQGVDTSLPATDSQVTVKGSGPYADLAITVNQTKNLTSQATSITWTGATPTVSGPGRFGSQYLQIMQCWGDDDGTNPNNPGPPPEQCEQGAVAGTYGGLPGGLYPAGFTLSRVISRSDWANFNPAVGHLDTRTTNVWLPFRSVGGTVVDVQSDPKFNPSVVGGNFWLNPYFNIITTNEIAGAVTGPNGKGAELFQVLTGVQSSGLGCGQRSQPVPGGAAKVPQCWIVVVPRGNAADENVGTPFETNAEQFGVATSPLAPSAWQHRIAIPIEFNPVDSPCSLAKEERRIVGSELALPAVGSWQPALCTGAGLPPYSYAPVSDSSARQQLAAHAPGGPGMIAVSRPLAAESISATNPVVYSPLSASGLVIGFNVERNPNLQAPPEELQLAGVRIADMNLTPRLVAKLLTQSYTQQVSILEAPKYPWLATNPAHLGLDPEFIKFNPEFGLLQIADGRTFSGLQLPAGNSDAAQQVWEWLLADPEASAWLSGVPDEWGMTVNPVYNTTAAANPTGLAFGDPIPNSFPKSDPYCFQAAPFGPNNSILPSQLCGTDWMPYKNGFAESAFVSRVAFDGAKIVQNPFAQTQNEVWTKDIPQFLGRRSMLSLTDTPSAAQYGLQVARLSRAGDNGDNRAFVAPDSAGIAAGIDSMVPKDVPAVREPAPTAVAPGAYPLATMTYVATMPLTLDAKARSDYAAFIEYATGAGQVPGLDLGQLPRGYAPLSESLKAQALGAAALVRNLVAAPAETEPATTVPTTTRPRPQRPPSTVPSVPDTTPTTVVVETTTTTAPVDPADVPKPTTPSVVTPIVDLAGSRFAVPGLAVMALGSALGVLEITKRPRRKLTPDPEPEQDADTDEPEDN
ncbi:MAG: hypothetical protein WCK14_07595 [Actinomycetota bacterium]|jgi:hypothetical protein